MPSKKTAKKTTPQPKITTDGKTVWVNGPENCLGRFCALSGEIMHADGGISAVHAPDSYSQWELWVAQMKAMHNFDVPDSKMPPFVKEFVED